MKYQIAKICLETTKEGVKKALVELPHDLDEMYLDILRSIRKRYQGAPRTITMAENALRWILCAVRPLTSVELLEAIPITPGQNTTGLTSNCVTVQTVLDICQPLLVLDSGSEVLRFAHFSVHEFLLKQYATEESHTRLAETCLTQLVNPDSHPILRRRLKLDGMLDYSTFNCMAHVQLSGAGGHCLTTLLKTFFTRCPAFQTWVLNVSDDERRLVPPPSGTLDPLLVACCYGLVDICAILLHAKADPDLRNHFGESSLHLAAIKGHSDITRLLLEHKRVSVNCTDWLLRTPLQMAAVYGHEEVARVLLDKGAHVNAADCNGVTPLFEASRNGYEAIVEMLLDEEANANAVDKDGNTLLSTTLKDGWEGIVKMLLDKGADVNAADCNNMTPLFSASRNGCGEIVQILLDNGADVNGVNNEGATPLSEASRAGHKAIVKSLLDKGANVNAANNKGFTPLFQACRLRYVAIVEMLLDKGADVNAANNAGFTPLHRASRKRNQAIVRILLGKGADVNAADTEGGTALHFAAYSGHQGIVKLLVDKGGRVNHQDRDGHTPLSLAVDGGHDQMVEMIQSWQIDSGEDPFPILA